MGEEHRRFVLDRRVLVHGRVDLGFEILDQLFTFSLHADGFAVDLDHLPPRGAPGRVGVGDDWSDLRQRVVVFLRQTGVAGEDDVRLCVGDGFEIDAVGLVEESRGLGVEFLEPVLDPGEDPVAVVIAEVRPRHADRDDAEGQRNLVIGPIDGGDPLGLLRDLRRSESMLDGHRLPRAVTAVGFVGGVGR